MPLPLRRTAVLAPPPEIMKRPVLTNSIFSGSCVLGWLSCARTAMAASNARIAALAAVRPSVDVKAVVILDFLRRSVLIAQADHARVDQEFSGSSQGSVGAVVLIAVDCE